MRALAPCPPAAHPLPAPLLTPPPPPPRQADIRDIKKAYKRLAVQWHPDKAPLAEKEAYEAHFKEARPRGGGPAGAGVWGMGPRRTQGGGMAVGMWQGGSSLGGGRVRERGARLGPGGCYGSRTAFEGSVWAPPTARVGWRKLQPPPRLEPRWQRRTRS